MSYSIAMCAYNEEKYIRKALESVFSQTVKPEKVVVVLDRCVDKTGEIAKEFPVEIVEKRFKKWNNSYAENLEIARQRISSEFIAIVDADVVLEPDYFKNLLAEIREEDACVSGKIVTKSKTILGRLLSFWEKTYDISPSKRPRGCALLIRKSLLDKIGGFADVPAPDTYVQDSALKLGYKIRTTNSSIAYHVREVTLRKAIRTQFLAGMARYIHGKGFLRTLLHSLVRLRPFVLVGYFYGFITNKKHSKERRKAENTMM
ncbi:MAG: glycosyltransferase family 2 protein [Thermoproteota archaeon]